MKAKKKRWWRPYWLFGRDQTCAGCGHHYAHAVEARCVACDRPHCPLCVTVVGGEPFCDACLPAGGGP